MCELQVKGSGDLIGTARIPLWVAYSAGSEFTTVPVLSGSGSPRGELTVRVAFKADPNAAAAQVSARCFVSFYALLGAVTSMHARQAHVLAWKMLAADGHTVHATLANAMH